MLVCPLSLLAMFVTYWKGGKKRKKAGIAGTNNTRMVSLLL